ncbi:hypothetical protein RF11_02068 [Thelohanellus kitauei]|uniref:Uncharacterized protein n=1 Tax=Thelohanellus kitauei TaxID=669202 RepID=A0A0C2ILV3_THEKT|nr:hypothetical protein RF11_02068 [Thelohanellus kitauei]
MEKDYKGDTTNELFTRNHRHAIHLIEKMRKDLGSGSGDTSDDFTTVRNAVISSAEFKRSVFECNKNMKRIRENIKFKISEVDLAILELNSAVSEMNFHQQSIEKLISSGTTVDDPGISIMESFRENAPDDLKNGITDRNILKLNAIRFRKAEVEHLLALDKIKEAEVKKLEHEVKIFLKGVKSVHRRLENLLSVIDSLD